MAAKGLSPTVFYGSDEDGIGELTLSVDRVPMPVSGTVPIDISSLISELALSACWSRSPSVSRTWMPHVMKTLIFTSNMANT